MRWEFNANGYAGVSVRDIRKLERTVKKLLPKKDHAVSLAFLSDAEMQKLNKRYRKKITIPNVLSFPSNESSSGNIGEVLVAMPKAANDAKAGGASLREHILYLFLHGVLHLLDYDHMNDKDAKTMEALEQRIIDQL